MAPDTSPSWTDALALDMTELDPAHHDFVGLLEAMQRDLATGTEDEVDATLARLLADLEAHFALEERWMAVLGLGTDNAHVYQHQAVLNVVRETCRLRAHDGDRELVRRLAEGLAHWFPAHGNAMDRALIDALAAADVADAPAADNCAAKRQARATPRA